MLHPPNIIGENSRDWRFQTKQPVSQGYNLATIKIRFDINGSKGLCLKILPILLLLAVLLPAAFSPVTAAPASPWQPLADGIDYREFNLPVPNRAYVVRMRRDRPALTLETGLAQGRLNGGLETVRGIAERYDGALNAWDGEWGGQNQVLAAVNGAFFDTQSGVPWSGVVHSGWYAKRFEDWQNTSGFAWTLDRQVFIGGCVQHRPKSQVLRLLATGEEIPFDGLNTPREDHKLIVYTPQYYAFTPASKEDVLEIVVQLERPLLILPDPDYVRGTVTEVLAGNGETLLGFDQVVLSAQGDLRSRLEKRLKPGDAIGFSQEIRHLTPDCSKPASASWTKTYAGVAGSYVFLRDGIIQPIDELGAVLRNPRTAVAYNDQYIFLIVVDGRDQLRSLGMSMADLAVFASAMLGASDGMALDGGGSSTMVVGGQVVNHPNAETVVRLKPDLQERDVANALLVVASQPRQGSTRWQAHSQVSIPGPNPVNLRLGPGTNYAVRETLAPGAQGQVLAHPLNGVLAKGYNWWYVDFNGLTGWVSESELAGP